MDLNSKKYIIPISWWKSVFYGGSEDNLQFSSREGYLELKTPRRKYKYYMPVIKSPAVRCDVGKPVKEIAPRCICAISCNLQRTLYV
jgi:hypothetical protein